MLTDPPQPGVEPSGGGGSGRWVQPGMLQRLLTASLLAPGILRLGVKQRCSCALHSVGCPDKTQPADMIRNRAQIRRVLCVAEKNDAAKSIADIMSSGRFRRVGLSNAWPLCVVCTITRLYMATSCRLCFWEQLCSVGLNVICSILERRDVKV